MPIVGDLATNVAASVLFEGIKRGLGPLAQTLRRRQMIDKSLVDRPDREKLVPRALQDLAAVIGNQHGVLTADVANFISEIEKSSMPEVILRCTLANEDPNRILPTFIKIYESFNNRLFFTKEQFFSALVAAIKAGLDEELKDKVLLQYIQALSKKTELQLDSVLRALSVAPKFDKLSFEEISETRLKIAKAIEAANRLINVETLQGTKRVNVRNFVVPARLSKSTAVDEARKRKQTPTIPSTISFQNFKTVASRAVVLGDPGGGKSTLTQMICYDLANCIILNNNFPDRREIEACHMRLPFRIILRSFEKRNKANPSYGILEYIIDEYINAADSDRETLTKVVLYLLSTGSALLLFDGLDENLNLDVRRQIVLFVEQFTSIHAACPVIVTSRYVGYRDAPLSDEFDIYELARFDPNEVKLFAERLIKVVTKAKKAEAQAKAATFVDQTKTIEDLRENPLMLGLMVYLFVYRGEVPAYKPEIYKECATLMFERWDQRRDIIVDIPSDFDLIDLFAFIASKVFGSAETEDGVTKAWLVQQLQVFFEVWYLDKPRALRSAKSLVAFITGRAWVMFEVGPGVYKFTHRTFLEYFFARHLNSNCSSVSDLIKGRLLEKIVRQEWDVIGHLALHSAVFRDGGKMIQAAESIHQIMTEGALSPQQQIGFNNFAAQALKYLVVPEKIYIGLAEESFKSSLSLGSQGQLAAAATVATLLRATTKRKSLVQRHLSNIMHASLSHVDNNIRYFSVFLLRRRDGSRFFRKSASVAASKSGLIRAYFEDVVVRNREYMFKLAIKSPLEAKLYISLYESGRTEIFRRHGLDCLFSLGPHVVFGRMASLVFDMISEVVEIFEDSLPSSNSPSKGDSIALLYEISNAVTKTQMYEPIPTSNILSYSVSPEHLISQIYGLACENRQTAKKLDISVRCLIVFAFFEDVFKRDEPKLRRNNDQKKPRLLGYMPSSPMNEMLSVCANAPLFKTFDQWNSPSIIFARESETSSFNSQNRL